MRPSATMRVGARRTLAEQYRVKTARPAYPAGAVGAAFPSSS